MNQDLLLTLIGLGVLLIIGLSIIVISIKRTGDKKDAKEFLEGLSDEIMNVMLDIISKISIDDFSDITDIEKIEAEILNKIYDASWKYIRKVVENNIDSNQDFFTKAILALLENREFVEGFIKELINNSDITNIIWAKSRSILVDTAQEKLDKSEEEDKTLQNEFSDEEKYIEEIKDEDQTHGEVKEEPTEEELLKLNPQVDEPEELDPENDSSVELIEEDDIYYDRSGRPRSKKTGKWVKMDKG